MRLLTIFLACSVCLRGQSVVYNIMTDFGAACNGSGNDNSAFTAFNSAALTWQSSNPAGSIELDIPSAAVCMFTSGGSGNSFTKGIKRMLVKGLGSGATRGTLSDNGGTGNGYFLGGTGQINDNVHSSRVNTVAAGSSVITLVTTSESSRFTTGQWALLAGIDLQGYGFPTNPGVFEYVRITNVNGGVGVITLQSSIVNSYKSTWPLYNAGNGFQVDMGGPATLYALDASWDTQVEYRNLILDQAGQIYGNGQSMTFTNVVTPHGAVIPSQNQTWTATNCDFTANTIEMDKIIGTVTLTNTSVNRIDFQSSSINSFVMTGGTVSSYFHGTPQSATITNATLNDFRPGAIAYGATTGRVICTSCVIPSVSPGGFSERVDSAYSLAGGMFKVFNTHGPVTWATPGATLVFSGTYAYAGSPFTVTDVSQDATYTYVRTSLAGGFPTLPNSGGVLSVATHPSPSFLCTSCTGSTDSIGFSTATAAPFYSYTKRTYSGNISTSQTVIPVFGTLARITINVTKAYTGRRSTLPLTLNGPFVVNSSGTAFIWNPSIDLKTVGPRTIRASVVAGAQSADSITAPGAIWLIDNQITPTVAFDISGEPANVAPIVTIEIITNQGAAGSASNAITELASFWEPGETGSAINSRIMWDHKGSAAGMYVGNGYQTQTISAISGTGFSRATGTQQLHNSGFMGVPAPLLNTGTGSFCYAAWAIISASAGDPIIGQWAGSYPRSWFLKANALPGNVYLTYAMTDQSAGSLGSLTTTVNAGDLALVWMAYDASTGQVKVAVNGDSWTSATPTQPFATNIGMNFDMGQINGAFPPAGSPVTGRTMFWNGYIPTDAEKTAIYNGGSGRLQSYFGLSYTPPAPPLTVSLVNATFADDTLLTTPGLYWLRPFPLKTWNPTAALSLGHYVWVRGPDHDAYGADCVQIGYSSSPEILPSSWSDIACMATLNAATGGSWSAAQNPHLEYSPEAGKIYLYMNATDQNIHEQTHVWTSTDTVSWTYGRLAFGVGAVVDGCAIDFPGYAVVKRVSAGVWTAQTLLNKFASPCDATRVGTWTSSDGLTWALVGATKQADIFYPYPDQDNQWIKGISLYGGTYLFNSYFYSSYADANDVKYPYYQLFEFICACPSCTSSEGSLNNFLQDVRAYEENGTVWLYAKWSYQQPSTVRLFKGTYANTVGGSVASSSVMGGNAIVR